MLRIVPRVLVLGVLVASSVIVVRAQSGVATPVNAARAANAPPLVPVRLNADGNFRIAPPVRRGPGFHGKAGCAKGPRHPVHDELRGQQALPDGTGRHAGGGRGAPVPAASAAPPQHQTFDRHVAVYVPAGYVANTPAPFIVVQDERWYVPEDAPPGRRRQATHRPAFIPVMLDNLIHEERIPPIVAGTPFARARWPADDRVRHRLGPLLELRGNGGPAPRHARLQRGVHHGFRRARGARRKLGWPGR